MTLEVRRERERSASQDAHEAAKRTSSPITAVNGGVPRCCAATTCEVDRRKVGTGGSDPICSDIELLPQL